MIDTHNPWMIVLAAAILMMVGALTTALARRTRRRRSAVLRERFGPEYERAIDAYGERRGELALSRARRVR